jgi:O-antigen/teichoic acid export membrane protein
MARRTGWGLANQAFSSLTNFALGVLIARSVTPHEFGAFSLAFATYTLLLGLSRALTSEPFVVRVSHVRLAVWRPAAAAAAGTATSIGVVGGAGCVLFGLATTGPTSQAFVALGLTLPGLLLQDSWRFAFFARGSGGQAFLNDLVWALIMFPAVVAFVATGHASMMWLTLGWGGAGAVAGLVGVLQARVLPRPALSARWLRAQRQLAAPYLGEFVAMSGARQLAFYAVGAIAGLAAAGAIRGAQVLLGPVQVLHNGARLAILPEAVRLGKSSVPQMRVVCNRLSAALSAVAMLGGAAVFFLPTALGRQLLGQTWGAAHDVAIPLAVMLAGGGISMGAVIGLRALAASDRSFSARMIVSVLQIAATIGGAFAGGAVAAAWGLAAGVWAGIPIWQWQLRQAIAERERAAGGGDRDDASSPSDAVTAPAAPTQDRAPDVPTLAAPGFSPSPMEHVRHGT